MNEKLNKSEHERLNALMESIPDDGTDWDGISPDTIRVFIEMFEKAKAMTSLLVMLAQTGMNKEQILKHFATQKEKAEKYDACGNLINQVNELLQENKQLKEDSKKWHSFGGIDFFTEDIANLKNCVYENNFSNFTKEYTNELYQKLEKLHDLVSDSSVQFQIKFWQDYTNLKQILEDVQKYLDAQDVPKYGYPWHIAVSKILKGKK